MSSSRAIHFVTLACAGVVLLGTVTAGQSRNAELAASADQPPPPALPVFRDPKTGTTWTPDAVGQDDEAAELPDRDSDGNPVFPTAPIELKPRLHPIGKVPGAANPSSPLVEMDSPSVQTAPDGHWYVVFYVQNNSDSTLATEVACIFGNRGRTVARAVIFVPAVEAGTRAALYFTGPTNTISPDSMTCEVSPP